MSGSDQLQLSFHATIPLTEAELAQVKQSAKSQEAAVLSWYALYEELDFTPSEVLKALIQTQRLHRKTPITSVRRAITNLTKCGWLEKLSKMRKGPAGKPEHAKGLPPGKWIKANRAHSKLVEAIRHIRSFLND